MHGQVEVDRKPKGTDGRLSEGDGGEGWQWAWLVHTSVTRPIAVGIEKAVSHSTAFVTHGQGGYNGGGRVNGVSVKVVWRNVNHETRKVTTKTVLDENIVIAQGT
jgi:hypothetical protein